MSELFQLSARTGHNVRAALSVLKAPSSWARPPPAWACRPTRKLGNSPRPRRAPRPIAPPGG
eukprot:4913406-Alexandrium_andersonii.AAC.1